MRLRGCRQTQLRATIDFGSTQGAAVSRPPKKGRRFGKRRSLEKALSERQMPCSSLSDIRNYFVTLTFPPNPRAFTLRSYIDSAKTGGTTKLPRLHDLIW
jgi:hypothetical protein